MGIEDSMIETKGAFFNIFLLTSVVPFVFSIVAEFLFIENQMWINIFISAFIINLVMVFEITILSHIYQKLTSNKADHENLKSQETAP